MNTTEDNRLIAEFMGAKPNNGGEYDLYSISSFSSVFQDIESDGCDKHFYFPREMKFDSDWNWIMAAIDKIDHTATVTIGRMFCEIKYQDPLYPERKFETRIVSGIKINAINGAVIEFIKWHNRT